METEWILLNDLPIKLEGSQDDIDRVLSNSVGGEDVSDLRERAKDNDVSISVRG